MGEGAGRTDRRTRIMGRRSFTEGAQGQARGPWGPRSRQGKWGLGVRLGSGRWVRQEKKVLSPSLPSPAPSCPHLS